MSEGKTVSDKKYREWIINPKTGYIRDADYQGRTWGEYGNDNAIRIHVIEAEALRNCETKLAKAEAVIQRLKEGLDKIRSGLTTDQSRVEMLTKTLAHQTLQEVAEMEAEREG